jgi:hypothetical protein
MKNKYFFIVALDEVLNCLFSVRPECFPEENVSKDDTINIFL